MGEAYARADELLATVGLSVRDLVQVTEFRTPDAAEQAGVRPQGVTLSVVPMEGLPVPGQRVAVQYTAVGGGGSRFATAVGVVTVAGGVVYLPGITPANRSAAFAEQYRSCLRRVGEALAAVKLGLGSLVQTTDYTASATRGDYPRCGRPRAELLGEITADGERVFPGAAGILVPSDDIAVRLDAVASMEPLRAVNPDWDRYDTLTYRPGVAAGNMLFMSGFAALDPHTQRALPGDLAEQADYTYAAIGQVLTAAGTDGSAVVRLVEYLTPAAVPAYHELEAIRRRHFPQQVALTSVVCTGLLRPEFLIEVVPTAVLR
ncbi:RidA family protein [Nocardia transvalensis]|nr:RidA family protein [Nocardia transvalensis]